MRKILQDKICMNDINKICIMTQGKENDHRKEELYQLTFDENDRVSFNALWALAISMKPTTLGSFRSTMT